MSQQSGYYFGVPPEAGLGSVTSVSVTTANGVSGAVATATTTPAITLTLGAITPASVASVGAISGTTITGTTLDIGGVTDTTFTRVSAGVAAIEGATIYTQGGALGTPASGVVTNLTGTASININGTVGATTPGTGAFTTLSASGALTANGAVIYTPQALSGAGAVDITTLLTKLTTTGVAQALTLADGANGQIKTVIHAVDGGSAVLTPTTKTGFTTITFTNAGESATLVFFTTQGWMIQSLYGAVAA